MNGGSCLGLKENMDRRALFWTVLAALFAADAGESMACAAAAKKIAIPSPRQSKIDEGFALLRGYRQLDPGAVDDDGVRELAAKGLDGRRCRSPFVAAPCQRLSGGGEAPIAGLVNLGNTCYFNSVIQALVHCTPLRNEVIKGKAGTQEGLGNVTQFLIELLRKMWDGNVGSRKSVTPSGLLRALCEVETRFKGYEQQDSHELLQALLHAAGSEEEKRLKAASSSGSLPPGTEPFPCNVFAGKTVSVVTCGGCQAKSQVTERFVDLSLNIPPELLARPDDVPATSSWGSGVPWGRKSSTGTRKNLFTAGGGSESDVSSCGDSDADGSFFADSSTGKQDASSVEECLGRFVQRETLESHEGVQLKCPKCSEMSQGGGRGATKQVRIKCLPECLVLHIKRFEVTGNGKARKLCASIRMSSTLDMSPYVEEGAEGGKQTYCLSAIVSHEGSMSYGHYTAYVKTPEGWVYASDTDVRGATDAEVYGERSAKSAYLMFYNRV